MKSFLQFLQEKLIIVGGGKRYGQVIFLAGGSGSGKGFAVQNFIHGQDYKVFDPDALKEPYLKWNEVTNKYPELRGRSLANPKDTAFVHEFLRDKIGLEDKVLNRFFSSITPANRDTLPNIIFDKTMKDNGDIKNIVPKLLKAGYKKENIHLIWVLTNYKVALQQNLSRSRSVPVTILIASHNGVAKNMEEMLTRSYPTDLINGEAYVVLGGRENTIFFEPDPKAAKTRKMFTGGPDLPPPQIVSEFEYIKVKESGRPVKTGAAISQTILFWIMKNAPDEEAIQKYLKSTS